MICSAKRFSDLRMKKFEPPCMPLRGSRYGRAVGRTGPSHAGRWMNREKPIQPSDMAGQARQDEPIRICGIPTHYSTPSLLLGAATPARGGGRCGHRRRQQEHEQGRAARDLPISPNCAASRPLGHPQSRSTSCLIVLRHSASCTRHVA